MADNATETPLLDLLAKMTADSIDAAGVDAHTLMVARLAALVAVDAGPASYLMNLAAAAEAGFDADEIRGVLAAVAPIVGTARIVTATSHIVEALGVVLELED